jgi:tetratricopeptide (TPR) repeat protein
VNFPRRFLPALLLLVLASLALAPPALALSSGDLIKQGVSLMREGKARDALDLFTKAQRLDPNGPKPHYYIGSALERLGEPDSAKAEYLSALRLSPKYVDALTGLGKLLRKQGQKDEGTKRLEEAVRVDAKDAPALYALGQAYLEDKRYDDAEKIFRKGTLLKQGRGVFLAGTALALEGKGDLKQAEELFIRARESDPNSLRIRLDLGGFYMRKKIPVLAAPEYGTATTLDPKNPETHYLYGKALVGMNEFNAALKAFVDATQQDSTFAPAYLESGHLFYRAKRYQEAADNFRVYTGLRPDDYQGYLDLGQALANSRSPSDKTEAMVALTKANELKPDIPEVLGNLCKLYYDQGESGQDSAMIYCDKYASKTDSLTAEEHMRVGTLYVTAGDSTRGLQHLSRAIAMDSTLAKDANFKLGYLFFAKGDYAASVPYFERTLQADSVFLPALLNMGLAKLQLRERPEAIRYLRRALVVKPNDARAMVWIGQTMLQMERDSLPVALELFRTAATVDSANGDALRGAGLSLLLMDRCSDAQQWLQRAASVEPQHVQGHIWLAQAYASKSCSDLAHAKLEFNKALEIDPTNREASRGLDNIRKFEQRKAASKTSGASTNP